MRFRLWPRSLATRTALVLLGGLALVQIAGLTIHALDRIDLQRLAQAREVSVRALNLYRAVVTLPPAQRETALHELGFPPGFAAALSPVAPSGDLPPAPPPWQRQLLATLNFGRLPERYRPQDVVVLGGRGEGRTMIGMQLPDGVWLNMTAPIPPLRPWHSATFLAAFLLMTATAALLTIWAVRRLTSPVRTLAAAAEALGRDVNAPPLPEEGPAEIATAAAAFNRMAARIRRSSKPWVAAHWCSICTRPKTMKLRATRGYLSQTILWRNCSGQ